MNPIRLVICDDKPDFRQMLELVLGINQDIDIVGQASDGREAIELVSELTPDVLLLDVAMPILDGIAALPDIKKASPNTTVIMMSGFASSAIKQEAAAAGAWSFVEKGARIAEISDAVMDAAQVGVQS